MLYFCLQKAVFVMLLLLLTLMITISAWFISCNIKMIAKWSEFFFLTKIKLNINLICIQCMCTICLHVRLFWMCSMFGKKQLHLYTPWLTVPGFLCNFSTDTFTDSYYETYYDRHHPLSNPPIGRQQEGIPGTRRRIMEDIAENEVSWHSWTQNQPTEFRLCMVILGRMRKKIVCALLLGF